LKNVSFHPRHLNTVILILVFAITAVFVGSSPAVAAAYSYSINSSSNDDTNTSTSSISYSRSFHYVINEDYQQGSPFNEDTGNSRVADAVRSRSYAYSIDLSTNPDPGSGIFAEVIIPESYIPETSESKVSIKTLAKGTKFATDLYIIESGKPGPIVMIVGGVHGNEPAGYTAAGQITDWDIEKGTLLVLPQANKRADERNVRYLSKEGDLNRDFPQSSGESADNTLSKAIWSALKTYDVEWLMDMHEGFDYYKNKSTDSVGQSLIYYPNSGTYSVVSEIRDTLNVNISNSYKEFSILKYPVKGSLAGAAGQYLGIKSSIMETCDNQSLSTRVNYQLKAAKTLLQELDMM